MSKYLYIREPRLYQRQAVQRIYQKKRYALFFDPGTGKTKPALDFIRGMLQAGRIQRVLILPPLNAVPVWEEQIEIDTPDLEYCICNADYDPDWTSPIIICNQEYFKPIRKVKRSKRNNTPLIDKKSGEPKKFRDKRMLKAFIDWNPDVVIIDELHKIKNRHSQTAKAAHRIARVCNYAIGLTGTPKGNKRLLDLWSELEFIQPGLLGPYQDFEDEYAIKGGFGGFKVIKFKNVPQLAKIIGPHTMRQKKYNLPPQVDIPRRVDMTPKAKEIYAQMEKDFVTYVDEAVKTLKGKTKKTPQEVMQSIITAPIALAKVTKLMQISGGFIRTNDGRDLFIHDDKLNALSDVLEELQESDVERVVIFAHFKWELAEIKKRLNGWNVYSIDGDTPLPQRKLGVQLFNTAGGIMLCQIASGSESLNLQAANYCIFYSVDHSFIHFRQARDRIHRGEQKETCFYYRLQCKGTLDAGMYRSLAENQEFSDYFLDLVEEIRSKK